MGSKSLGILQGLSKKQEDKNIGIQEQGNTGIQEDVNTGIQEQGNTGIQEDKTKRTYKLKHSTILKLGEMKVSFYPTATELSDIVDEAICRLYESKKQG